MESKPAVRIGQFAIGALVVAWLVDFLFWMKQPGISMLLIIAISLAVGMFLLLRAGIRPAPASLVLVALILFFGVLTFIRREEMTAGLSFLAAGLLMAIFASTFTGGRWIYYNLADYVVNGFHLALSVITRAIGAWAASRRDVPAREDAEPPAVKPRSRRAAPVLRGILLAIPVLAIMASLLASADPLFSRWLNQALAFLRIENLPEYIFRGVYILIIAVGLTGIYLHAALDSKNERVLGQEKAWLRPFLGSTEAGIVLGSLAALFIVFVAIQFQYFFGGHTNINAQGFTYAEYARRGFGELVAVAVISLGLLLGFSAVTRREKPGEKRLFTVLGITVVALVLVILVSAYQRLTLYEGAYGFTSLRTYTHVFIIWLGVLLAATIVLELINRLNAFALAALVVGMGFVASLGLLNVDSLIVHQNVLLSQAGRELDSAYLASLSDDAVPAMAEAFQAAPQGSVLKEGLGAALVCHQKAYLPEEPSQAAWQSFHLSTNGAGQVFDALQPQLSGYVFSTDATHGSLVDVGKNTYPCFSWAPDGPVD